MNLACGEEDGGGAARRNEHCSSNLWFLFAQLRTATEKVRRKEREEAADKERMRMERW